MKKRDLDKFIDNQCVKYAATHSYPKVNGEWLDGRDAICDLCPTDLETGRTKTVTETYDTIDENGQKVTVTRTKEVAVTIPFDAYSEYNKHKVRETLERAFVEKQLPALNIPWRPNLQLWMKALAYLFFNVKDVKATVKAVYNFVSALRDNSVQTLLYLYSDKSGGTGKTWVGEQLKWYFNCYIPGGKANTVTDIKDGFINPQDFNSHMTFLDDFNPNRVEVETLNNLIDHHEMSYNIKFGPKGRFTNNSVLVASSNYLPKNVNTRRWSVVEYNSYNVADHVSKLDPEKVHQAVIDLIECCPLKLDFTKLESPDASCLNYELLQHIIDNSMRIPSRIIDFVDGDQKRACQLANMLVDLQSKHLLPLNWKRTPVMMHKFNWKTIADWIIEKQLLVWDEFDGDVVDHTIEEWNELAVELCGPYDNGPHDNGPHDSKLDTHNDFKSFVDTKLTHFSSASQVSSSSEAQLCSNCVRRDGSKVQLRDTNTDVRPVVMAFESDSMSVTDQEANIKQSVWDAKVFSGNKSLHVLVQVPDEISLKLDSLDDDLKVAAWHRLYHTVAGILFKDTSKLDMACKSWLRKFRTPDGIRDNGKTQTAEFNTHKQPLHWDSLLEWAIETTKLEQANMKLKLSRRSAASKQRDVSADMRVRRYLDTPFEKTCGNGISDSLLYKSICVCTQANDDATLTEVLQKAKSEKWTDKELSRKCRDAKKLCA